MKKATFLFCLFCSFSIPMMAQNAASTTATAHIAVNNVDALITNGGDMWWDRGLGNAAYKVPKTGNASSNFAGAIWLGGLDNANNLHLAAQTFRQNGNDFFAGPLDNTGQITTALSHDYDKIWRVSTADIQTHIANASHSLSNTPTSILEWPAKGNTTAKGNSNVSLTINEPLAPFMDVDGDGNYNALNGDYPLICGDEALWFVMNDAGNVHTETNAAALGMQVQVMVFAYNGNGYENNTTYYTYKLINKSSNTYHNFYISLWQDPDLGCSADDYLGCDSTRNMMLAYNADANDDGCSNAYSTTIPMQLTAMINPPRNGAGLPVNMSSFIYYYNTTPSAQADPLNAKQYYQYMRGFFRDSTHLTFGGNGHGGSTLSNFAYSDNPSLTGIDSANGQNYWSMCNPAITPGDLRSVMSFGPLTIPSGDEKEFTYAATTVFNITYPCPSFVPAQQAMDYVKIFYENNACSNIWANGLSNTSADEKEVQLIPNPANDYVTIKLPETTALVTIANMLGQTIYHKQINGTVCTISTANWEKGTYLVHITDSKTGLIKSKKLVIE